jgi:hypothetical protein
MRGTIFLQRETGQTPTDADRKEVFISQRNTFPAAFGP